MDNSLTDVKKKILVVDDTPENIDILKDILLPQYKVQIATNGRMALKIAMSNSPPDIILMDVMMPEMDGYEACQHLKNDEKTRDIPILFLTAKSSLDDEIKGFEVGAADYLIKPISPPIVLARVKNHLAIHDQAKLLADQIEQRTSQLISRNKELEKTRLDVIRQLGRAAEYRDNETGLHIVRMAKYAYLLALKAGLSEPEAGLIMMAAPLHDVGKIGIPDSILLKPDKLTSEEFDVIKTHSEIGFKIIGEQDSDLLKLGGELAYCHHEKWNGKGYPRGLKGEEIPIASRIVSIADVFDALTSSRPYKKGWTINAAFDLIEREQGEHFDPTLAPLFISLRSEITAIMSEFPDDEVA